VTGRAPECGGCGLPEDRRTFLREAGLAAAGILVALGAPLGVARAMPLELVGAPAPAGRARVTYPIPAADGVQLDRGNELFLVRWQKVVYAFELSCPHQNTALRWNDGDKRFQCPKHKSQYGPDGVYIEGRATRSMDRLGIKREGRAVVVDVDLLFKEDENPAEWKAAMVAVT
jgi:Rieske Fe-S protein